MLDPLAVAERELVEAVAGAAIAGRSWRRIGAALGTSGEVPRQKYGPEVRRRSDQSA